METEEQLLRETYRLAKENNRMLHAMRRNAFLGGMLRLVVYAVLIIAPLWFYATYLAPTVNQMIGTMNQVQGASAKAQAQFGDLQGLLDTLRSQLSPGQ